MNYEMWNQTMNKGRTYLIALAGSRTEYVVISELPRTGEAPRLLPCKIL